MWHANDPFNTSWSLGSGLGGGSSVGSVNDNCTTPVDLNALETARLRSIMINNAALRMALDNTNESLFSEAFSITMGQEEEVIAAPSSSSSSSDAKKNAADDGAFELDHRIKKNLIEPHWLPALKEIRLWIFCYGLAPYFEEDIILPDISNLSSTSSSSVSSEEEEPKHGREAQRITDILFPSTHMKITEKDHARLMGKTLTNENKKTSKKRKRTTTTNGDNDNDYDYDYEYDNDNDEKKEKTTDRKKKRTKKTIAATRYKIIRSPSFDSGFISTYTDEYQHQQFLWTWFPDKVSPGFRKSQSQFSRAARGGGLTDFRVKFIVSAPPTLNGDYTSQLKSALKDFLYFNTRKTMDIVSMKHRLNPVHFLERQEKQNNVSSSGSNKDKIDNAGFSSSYGFDTSSLKSHDLTSAQQQQLLQSLSTQDAMSSSRAASLSEFGFDPQAYAARQGLSSPQNIQDFVHRIQADTISRCSNLFSAGGSGAYMDAFNSYHVIPFGLGSEFGRDELLLSDLGGNLGLNPQDPFSVNSMSGSAYRLRPLEEGQKIVSQPDNMDPFINRADLLHHQEYLDQLLCSLAGYPLDMISGLAGGTKGKADAGRNRDFVNRKLGTEKLFYEKAIAKMFLSCFESSFVKSKSKAMNRLRTEKSLWPLVDKYYDIRVTISLSPQTLMLEEMKEYYAMKLIKPEEFVKLARTNAGLDNSLIENKQELKLTTERLDDILVNAILTENKQRETDGKYYEDEKKLQLETQKQQIRQMKMTVSAGATGGASGGGGGSKVGGGGGGGKKKVTSSTAATKKNKKKPAAGGSGSSSNTIAVKPSSTKKKNGEKAEK